MTRVAALYVDPRGPYPRLVEDWYDEARDATRYTGPLPVVAHPPCGPWGRLAHQCTKDRADLAPLAVEQVRQFGGVLEHPAASRLWKYCRLPEPDTLFPDEFGGVSYLVAQGDYGHRAPKLTWLYAVRLGPCPFVLPGADPGGRVQLLSHAARRRTPDAFASELVRWAATARAVA